MAQDELDLALCDGARERREDVGLAEVPFVFGDLVLCDQMIAESVPGQLADEAVILVEVFGARGEDQIRLHLGLDLLESILDLRADEREVAFPERIDFHLGAPGGGEEVGRAAAGLRGALAIAGEDFPADGRARTLREQPQDGPPATDFQVIAVRREAEDSKRSPAGAEGSGNQAITA